MVALMIALVLAFCYWLYVAAGAYNTPATLWAQPSHCGGSDFGYWCWRGIWQRLVESGVGKALANMLQMIDLLCYQPHLLFHWLCVHRRGQQRSNPDNRRVTLRSGDGIESDQCVLVTLAACFGGLGASHIMTQGSGL